MSAISESSFSCSKTEPIDCDSSKKAGSKSKRAKVRKTKVQRGRDHAPRSAPLPGFFMETVPSKYGRTFRKLEVNETFEEGLRSIDSKLLTKINSKRGILTRHTVLEGEIGMGTKYGKTKFFPPGTYFWAGIGGKWFGVEELQKDGEDVPVVHQDVTYLPLTENQAAVIQIGKNQHIIGSGRYIIRQPARLEGKPVDIQQLKKLHKAIVFTEGSEIVEIQGKKRKGKGRIEKSTKIVQTKKKVTAGWTAKTGAITFIRPEPGFEYVIQMSGGYRIGTEFTVARGEEKFLSFMNLLHQSRTAGPFHFICKDHQKVVVSVQLTWKVDDGIKWLQTGRAYDDPYDLMEEKAEAYFRDEVAALTHEEALEQKADGFDDMEKRIFPKLQKEAKSVGAKLLSMEVRDLRFPLIEQRALELAEKEATNKEKILQRKREIDLQKLKDVKTINEETAQQKRDEQAEEANLAKMKISDARALEKVEAKAKQNKAGVDGKARAETARLEAAKRQTELKAEMELIEAKGKAAAKKAEAEGEATSILIVEQAKNKALLERAQAVAKAAGEMAEALGKNTDLLELEKAKLIAQVEMERAKALAQFANNPQALLPDAITRDLVRMRNKQAPQEYMPVLGQISVDLKEKH